MNQITMSDFFKTLGYDFTEMTYNIPVDVREKKMQVKSIDTKSNTEVWADVTKIVRKDDSEEFKVDTKKGAVSVSPFHMFYAKVNGSEPTWVEVFELHLLDDVEILTENGWECPKIEKTGKTIPILDIEVDKTNCYFSNGVLSHNTMYGDPFTTPGGKAVPYHASVRVRLTRGSTEKDNEEEIMGVNTSAKVFKNRMGPPLRKCKFFISFAHGIEDEASWFNALHERNLIEKRAGWCYMDFEKDFKFREAQWTKTLEENPKFKEWVLNKLEEVMIVKYGQKSVDMEADPESLMEVEQTVEDLIDPK